MTRRWRGTAVVALATLTVGLSTDFRSPPRYDGAGYSVLGLSLATGRGYREIDRPDAPRHDHFPPGYPLVLAGAWSLAGRSVVWAHGLSAACTVAAAWLAWRWLRRVEPGGAAALLGMAVAVNWTWASNGGAIQSEPLYLLLSMASLLIAMSPPVWPGLSLRAPVRWAAHPEARRLSPGHAGGNVQDGQHDGPGPSPRVWGALGLGILLGLCTLTRHVGACLLVAVVLDRISRGRWRDAGWIGLGWGLVVSPWVVWLASVRRNSQAGLLDAAGLGPRVAGQILFYARRLPDALSGPFVEVATVFAKGRWIGIVATAGAAFVSLVVVAGLIRAVREPRRRLAGLVPMVTLPLLLIWPFTEAGRFLIPLVPCLLVGAVEGGSWIGGHFVGRPPHPALPLKGGGHHVSPPPLRGRAGWGVHRRMTLRTLVAATLFLAAIPYTIHSLLRPADIRRRLHADFDDACAYLRDASRPGAVLTRHPGEVFWQTGRLADAPASDDPEAIARQIRRDGIAYLLVDPDRFANAPPTPLARFAADRPGDFREVFDRGVIVYQKTADAVPDRPDRE